MKTLNSISTLKITLIFSAWVLFYNPILAQGLVFCSSYTTPQPCTSNPDSLLYDRFGNAYCISDLSFPINNLQPAAMCLNAGYFNFMFEGSPSEDVQMVICEVFNQLSLKIQQRQNTTSCNASWPQSGVNILVRWINDPNEIPPGALGAGTALYYDITRVPTEECKGVSLDRPNIKINGGTPYGIHQLFDPQLVDGILILNSAFPWNLNWTSQDVDPSQYDLYTTVLHEALHILGFAARNPNPANMNSYMTLWNQLLYTTTEYNPNGVSPNIKPVYLSDCSKNCWSLNPELFLNYDPDLIDKLEQTCNNNTDLDFVVGSNALAPIQGPYGNTTVSDLNALSHLNGTCNGQDKPYVMVPILNPGTHRREISVEELKILCELGYQIIDNISPCNGCYNIAQSYYSSSNHSNCCDRVYHTCVGEKIHIDSDDLLCSAFSNGDPQEITSVWSSIYIYKDYIDIIPSGSGWDITINQIPINATGVSEIFFSYTVTGCNCRMENAAFSILVEECFPCGNSENSCQNLLCYSDFSDYNTGATKKASVWFDHPFFVDFGNQSLTITEAFIQTEPPNNNYLLLSNYSPVTLELKECVSPRCELQIDFDASKLYSNDAVLQLWGSKYAPCLATDNPPVPISPVCGIVTDCNGNLFSPYCINPPTSIINIANGFDANLQSYPTIKWLNNTPDEICFITLFPKPVNSTLYTTICLDNISAKRQCTPKFTIAPEGDISECIGNKFNLQFEICADEIPGAGSSHVQLHLSLPSGINLINGNPDINTTLVEGQCLTLNFDLEIEPNLLLQGSTLDLSLFGTATGVCSNLNIDFHKSVIVPECMPCACTGSNSINIAADDHIGTSVTNTIIPSLASTFLTLPNALVGKCLAIKGKLIIENGYDLSIVSGEVRMQPGSEIIVKNSTRLTILSVTENGGVHGCVEMWKGISVENGAQFNLYTSTMQDAINAITLYNNSTINLLSNVFDRNYVGVFTPTTLGSSQTINTIYPIQNNTFQCSGFLLPPYANQITRAGFEINNALILIGSLSGNAKNTFSGIKNGVIGEHSFISINNANFTDLLRQGAPQYPYNRGTSIGISTGILIAERCTTNVADVGIQSINSYTNARYNNISNVYTGIFAALPTYGLYLEDNYLTSYKSSGIYLFGNSNSITVKPNVTRNTFFLNTNNFSKGIDIRNFTGNSIVTNPLLSKIKDNIFNLNYTNIAISLVNCNEVGLESNIINYQSATLPSQIDFTISAIDITNTSRSKIFTNNISFPPSLALIKSSGIYSGGGSSASNIFCCNSINGARNGFKFENNTFNSLLRNNLLASNEKALLCSGIMGNLNYLTNNTWNGEAEHNGSDLDRLNSLFTIHTCNQPKWPSNITPAQPCDPASTTNWFQKLDGQALDCAEDRICNRPLFHLEETETDDFIIDDTISTFDISVAKKLFLEDLHGDFIQSEVSRQLFEKITTYPELIGENFDIDSFYLYASNNNIAKFHTLYNLLRQYTSTDSTLFDDIIKIKMEIDSILNNIKTIDSIIIYEDSLSISGLLAISKYNTIQSLSIAVDSFMRVKEKIDNRHLGRVQIAQQLNNLISPINIIEQNEKIANEVFFETLDKGITRLDSQQLALITPIAYQCLVEGGRGVLRARHLYSLMNDTINFNYIDNYCLENEARSINNKKNIHFKGRISLRPNPARDVVYIESSIKYTFPLIITIRSLDNRIAKEVQIDDYSSMFSISGLPPGVYFCTIFAGGDVLELIKLVII